MQREPFSRRCDGSQVHCTTHSSLWADLGTIMMDGVADLSSGSAELDFIDSTFNTVVIKPGQTVATAIQVDSVEKLPDSEPDGDKSIPSTESVFSCVKRKEEFLYPCIVSDEAMDAEDKEFDLDLSKYLGKKGTMLKCVHELYFRATKNLSTKESAKVKELLVKNNETTFHDPKKPLTTTNTIEHEIPMTGRPVRIPLRRVAPGQRKIVEDKALKMEKEGMIAKSVGPWCSPIVLVRKKDGTICFCVDYRKLKDVTHQDTYLLPRIDDILEALRGAKYFYSIDLASGYWQIKVVDKDREKTVFGSHLGLYEFLCMPFGLTGAPATFSRLMDKVLHGLIIKKCLVYLDDMIFGSSFEETLANLRLVMDHL